MSFKEKKLEVQPGVVLHDYSVAEAQLLEQLWLESFGQDAAGTSTKDYLWHIFSANKYPHACGTEALMHYLQQQAPEYIVLSNDRRVAFSTSLPPEHCYLSDYYVFPKNMAWTMAFTHEDGWLGPYFARHRNFDRLNAANLAKMKKAKAIEVARLKGWC
jgi:Domain of unknown function (DUF4275)